MNMAIEERSNTFLMQNFLSPCIGEAIRIVVDLINLALITILNDNVLNRVWTRKDISYDYLRVLTVRILFMFLEIREQSLMIK